MKTEAMQTAAMKTAEMKAVESKIAEAIKADKGAGTKARRSANKSRRSERELKKHLRYMMPEITLALIREPGEVALPIECPEDIEKYVKPMKFYSEEHFVAFHLNARHEVTSYNMVSKGSVSASLVHPREVFKAALLANTYAVIVAHNHPGGSRTPSKEDLETTEQLVKGGKLLGVTVIDHIIVTVNGISSIRESHPELWRER